MNHSIRQKRYRTMAVASALALAGAGGGWLAWRAHERPVAAPARSVYTAQGYGGFVAAPRPPILGEEDSPRPPILRQPEKAGAAADPVRPMRAAYEAGRYGQAEAQARRVITLADQAPTLPRRERAAQARQILAYAAARRHDLGRARVQFAALRTEAARLPDRGAQPAPPGASAPTLEAEAAFQHAVCTGALGESKAAEAEYRAFLARYPESPLVHAAVARVARLHGGDVPPQIQALWRRAQGLTVAHQKAQLREASLCGPECLAELLRRRGAAADVHALAAEMGTSDQGTTLSALAAGAQRHGWRARGLALTPKGLGAQPLPLIALTAPGHYVLVEAVSPQAVTVWDPDAWGVGKGGRRAVPAARWGRDWQGVALALTPPAAPVRTARR